MARITGTEQLCVLEIQAQVVCLHMASGLIPVLLRVACFIVSF